MMRNNAVLVTSSNFGNGSGISRDVLIPVRCSNPSTYVRIDDRKPKSSSEAGCSKWETVRTSFKASSILSSASAKSSLVNCCFTFPKSNLGCYECLPNTIVEFAANSPSFIILCF